MSIEEKMYRRKIELIKALACDELEIEKEILEKRKDGELKKVVAKICESCHISDNDKCPLCNSKFEDCPEKNLMAKEISKFYQDTG